MSDGWASLSHKLGELPWTTQSAIKKIAMGQATKKVQGTAKRKAPGFSGDLRKQIYTKNKFEADAIVGYTPIMSMLLLLSLVPVRKVLQIIPASVRM